MPGYTGYLPGQREHIEITRAELSKGGHKHSDYNEQISDFNGRITKDRGEYKKLAASTRGIPGWTGYVPRKSFTHGSESFATSQAKCIKDFTASTEKRVHDTTQILEAAAQQPSLNSIVNHDTPAMPRPQHDLDRQGLATAGSMRENWRKSGYTGYVPGTISGNIFGMPVQRRNDRSTRVFDKDIELLKRSAKNDIRPVTVSCERQTKFKEGGIIPRYQGYVPGRAYRFGENLSRDAARVCTPKTATTIKI